MGAARVHLHYARIARLLRLAPSRAGAPQRLTNSSRRAELFNVYGELHRGSEMCERSHVPSAVYRLVINEHIASGDMDQAMRVLAQSGTRHRVDDSSAVLLLRH